MNFKEELEQRTREAEEIIKSYLPKEEGFAKNMAEAMNYSMLSGGKRLRPVFMREVYSMFGGTGKVIEPFMAFQSRSIVNRTSRGEFSRRQGCGSLRV